MTEHIAHQSIDIMNFGVCTIQWKKIVSSGIWACISNVNSWCATTCTKTQNHTYTSVKSITGHTKTKELDDFKIGNIKRTIGIIKMT